jgi:hypothetical protein
MTGEKVKIRSTEPIYGVVEDALKNSEEPMTCAMLMDQEDVRRAACERFGNDIREATNRLSDLLGFMWRRGLLHRYTAPFNQGSLARYAYGLKKLIPEEPKEIPFTPSTLGVKPQVAVVKLEDGVQLDLQHFTVIIRTKRSE